MTNDEKERLRFIEIQKERRTHLKKFALTLLQQCKDENLSVVELNLVLQLIQEKVSDITLRDGLAL